MDYQIDLKVEDKELLMEFLKEVKILNENLQDLKTMIAPLLGFRIKKGEK